MYNQLRAFGVLVNQAISVHYMKLSWQDPQLHSVLCLGFGGQTRDLELTVKSETAEYGYYRCGRDVGEVGDLIHFIELSRQLFLIAVSSFPVLAQKSNSLVSVATERFEEAASFLGIRYGRPKGTISTWDKSPGVIGELHGC